MSWSGLGRVALPALLAHAPRRPGGAADRRERAGLDLAARRDPARLSEDVVRPGCPAQPSVREAVIRRLSRPRPQRPGVAEPGSDLGRAERETRRHQADL